MYGGTTFLQYFDGKLLIMNYDEIIDYINRGYKTMRDLKLLLKYDLLTNNKKYKIWLFENEFEKLIDVHGGNLVEEYIPTHIIGEKVIKGYYKCHPTDHKYLVPVEEE